jgi:uncharacterized membrane protein
LEDLFFGLMGTLLCLSPFALLGGLIYLLNRSPGADKKRADELEWRLESLRAEHHALTARVARLEARPLQPATSPTAAPNAALAAEARAASIATGPRDAAAFALTSEVASTLAAGPLPAGPATTGVEGPPSEAQVITSIVHAEAAARATSEPSSESAAASTAAASTAAASTAAASTATASTAAASAPTAEQRAANTLRASEAVGAAAGAAALASVGASPPVSPPPAPPGGEPAEDGGGFEQLIGVKGAAVLGALVLVVAGLYFFQYSIEHGLIGPELRVAMGFVVGIACLVLSERPLRTLAPALSPWLAGAGIAILYSASWASAALFHLVPHWVAGLLMVAVTTTATLLAIRRESLPIAILGLLGGFITPLALSTGEDHPIPLFAYLLVLDGAILYVAHRRGWPSLGLLALLATTFYQLGWLGGRMSESTALIGLAIVVLFAGVFAFVPLARPTDDDDASKALPLATRVGGVLLPFLLVLTFVFRTEVAFHAWPTLALVILASVSSLVVARREAMGWLAPVAAVMASGVTLVFVFRWWASSEDLVPLALLSIATPLLYTVFAELERYRAQASAPPSETANLAAAIPVLGMLLALLLSAGSHTDVPQHPYLYLGLFVVVLILGLRQSSVAPLGPFAAVLALGASITAFVGEAVYFAPRGVPSGSFLLACEVLPVVLFTLASVLARPEQRKGLDLATVIGACATLTLVAIRIEPTAAFQPMELALTLGLVFVLGLLPTGRTAPVSLSLVVLVCAAVSASVFAQQHPVEGAVDLRLALLFFVVGMSVAWPFLARRVGADAWGWRLAALAGPLSFVALRFVWIETLGDAYLGALPVILGALVLVTAMGARRRTVGDPVTQRTATVWLAAVAAGFVTLAIPLQLSNEWLTIGWVLEATALLALDSRLRHAGLRYFALALYALVLIRLSPIPYLLEYHERGAWRLVNWLSYTYLVPALSFSVGSYLLSKYEVAERSASEKQLIGAWGERPIFSGLLFSGVVALVFVWLNLTIIDWYATGPYLVIPTDLVPARGLTISAAWASYALGLLGLGMWRSSTALRITSLLLMLATCAKVFLHDLSNLGDLYRVAALVFLALSLIAVSFFYQRFVFKRPGTS